MLKSLWRRLSPSGPGATAERALARYFRDEGLHAELEALRTRQDDARSACERILYEAQS
jgi:hypothetical protein